MCSAGTEARSTSYSLILSTERRNPCSVLSQTSGDADHREAGARGVIAIPLGSDPLCQSLQLAIYDWFGQDAFYF